MAELSVNTQPVDEHDYTVAGRAIGRWIARSCAESPTFRAKVNEIIGRAREEHDAQKRSDISDE